jgi:hypothetical protein
MEPDFDFDNRLIYPEAQKIILEAVDRSIDDRFKAVYLKDLQEQLYNTDRHITRAIRDDEDKDITDIARLYKVTIKGRENFGLAYGEVTFDIVQRQTPVKNLKKLIGEDEEIKNYIEKRFLEK